MDSRRFNILTAVMFLAAISAGVFWGGLFGAVTGLVVAVVASANIKTIIQGPAFGPEWSRLALQTGAALNLILITAGCRVGGWRWGSVGALAATVIGLALGRACFLFFRRSFADQLSDIPQPGFRPERFLSNSKEHFFEAFGRRLALNVAVTVLYAGIWVAGIAGPLRFVVSGFWAGFTSATLAVILFLGWTILLNWALTHPKVSKEHVGPAA
jgi:hypothetical protein